MACTYTYQGKTYSASEFDDVLRAMSPSTASKYMPGVSVVPDAPMVGDTKAWVALGIKRAIMHALDVGADGIVFGTGQQNADLYDLSKQVDSIEYRVSGNQNYRLRIFDKKGNQLPTPPTLGPDGIEEYVGKDMAEKIIATATDADQKLSGLDLKVGGEGMRAFYDKIVPQVANDVLKKLGGGKVGTVEFDSGQLKVERDGVVYDAMYADAPGVYSEKTQQPGFPITIEMRAKAETTGVPLFSMRRRPAGQTAGVNDYLVPDASPYKEQPALVDLAYLSGKPIRLTVGVQIGSHRGHGMEHIGAEAKADGYRVPPDIDPARDDLSDDTLADVLRTLHAAPQVYRDKGRDVVLHSRGTKKAVVLASELDPKLGDYWSVKTTYPTEYRSVWGAPEGAGRLTFPATPNETSGASQTRPLDTAVSQPSRTGLEVTSEAFQYRAQAPAVQVTTRRRRAVEPGILASASRQSTNLDDIYAEAAESQVDFGAAIREIAGMLGVKADVPDTLKGRERAEAKIAADYKGDASKIKDILRASLVVDSLAEATVAMEALADVFPVHSSKNSFGSQTPIDGYRDGKVVVWVGNVAAEVQIQMSGINAVKGNVHTLYEERQKIERAAVGRDLTPREKARIAQLNSQMAARFQPVWERATMSRKVPSVVGYPLREALSQLKRRWSGSNAKQPSPPSELGMMATGTSSTSRNLVPEGNDSGSGMVDSLVSDNDIRASTNRKTPEELAASAADAMSRGDEPTRSHMEQVMQDAEARFIEAKRGVVPTADTEAAGKALAASLGWSTRDVAAVLQLGNIDIGGGKSAPAADLLAAGAETARVAMADLLDNPTVDDFGQKMTDTINLMIATRAIPSESARALHYWGWLQRNPGASAQQKAEKAIKAMEDTKKAAKEALGVSGNMSEEERAKVNAYNQAMRDATDAQMDAEEALAEAQAMDQDLAEARRKMADAQSAKAAAKQALRDAQAELKKMTDRAAAAVDKTPDPFEITQAEGAARRAEKEAEASKERMSRMTKRLEEANDRLDKAKKGMVDPATIASAEKDAKLAEGNAQMAKNLHDANKRKLKDAQDRLKIAQAKIANFKAKTPTAADILQAQAAARQAEKDLAKVIADLRDATKTLAKLRAKIKGAIDRAAAAGNKLRAKRNQIAILQKPMFVGKGGVSMDEIIHALGGQKGLDRLQQIIIKNRPSAELTAMFFQGVAGAIHKRKEARAARTGVWGKVHNFLSGVLELFRANILTGLLTHGVNTLSNVVFQTVNMGVTRPLAEGMWGGAGAGRHYRSYNRAMLQSFADVWPAIVFGMSAEFPVAQFDALTKARPELQKVLLDLGGNKWMDHNPGAIPGLPGRVVRTYGFAPLGAADLVFKMVPYRYSINLQNAQGQPVDYSKAVETAEYEVFQKELKGFLATLPQAVTDFPVLGFVMPFIKTLINLISSTVDYTPVLGQLKNIDELLGHRGNDARRLALAQGIVGAVLATIAVMLHGDGDDDPESLLSGMGPIKADQKALWLANHEKLGLKLGDVIVPLWRIEPFASMMGLSIAASDAIRATDAEAAAKRLAAEFMNVVIGKSFMVGPADAVDALTNNEGSGYKYLTDRLPKSIATALAVPNFVNQMGDFTDEYKREALTWAEAFAKKVPAVREGLNPALDYAGEPIPESRYGNPTPIQMVPVKDDPLARFLLREDIPLQRAPKLIKELSHAERQKLLQIRAKMLKGFAKLPPTDNKYVKEAYKEEVDSMKGEWSEMAGEWAEARRLQKEAELAKDGAPGL